MSASKLKNKPIMSTNAPTCKTSVDTEPKLLRMRIKLTKHRLNPIPKNP
jgi:uncharacterized protein YlaI